MQKFLAYLLPVMLLPNFSASRADELDELILNSKKLADNYSSQLLTAYDNAYSAVSFDAVREVCRKTALELANRLSTNGHVIRRISVHPLNEQNIPDQTEKKVLQDFIARQTEGKEVDKLVWYKLQETGNRSEFRYIKAFILEQRCITCHKTQTSENEPLPELAAYSVKRIETKNYFPEEFSGEQHKPLPVFEE
jgi:hypothetical protein